MPPCQKNFEKDKLDEISDATFRRIVRELARFNLSATGDDVKGLAFEKFLGDTFRGELGQYFTPRSVVDFMVKLLDPQEGQLVCDPCSGSGGFLIRAFEHVRDKIEADVEAKKADARADVEKLKLEEVEAKKIAEAFAALNRDLEPEETDPPSRIRKLAHDYIFGTDAESRAARTSKMNMIMHGDGHGGIHYHDGLIDINGVFPGRFDLVFTNPPFGSNVGEDQKVGATEQGLFHYRWTAGRANIDIKSEVSSAMPQLIVRQIEEKVVRKLKERAGQHGVSMEEEHRRILRNALLESSRKKRSFKDYLFSMPNVGEDKDFERSPQVHRPVQL